jgi:DNA-binding HxlR family transcriptional regulator
MEMNTVLYAWQPCEISDHYEKTTIHENVTTEEPARNVSRASFSAWSLLGKRWTFLIVAQLLIRPQSFQELFAHTQGISESVLSERLKELEREGVLQRLVHNRRPIRVTYHLTEKGKALAPVISAIDSWSQHL